MLRIKLTAVQFVGAIRTLVLSVAPEPQFNTRSVLTSELVHSAVLSRINSYSCHAHKTATKSCNMSNEVK